MTLEAASDSAVLRALALTGVYSDEAPLADLGKLLADDIVWTMPGRLWTGRDEVVEGLHGSRASGIVGPGSRTRHFILPPLVEADGSVIRTRSHWLLVRAGTPTAEVLNAGEYHDTWRIVDGAAVLVSREVVPL